MVVIRRVVICTESRLYWDEGAEPECQNHDHQHRVLETHRHLSPVVLPDGTRLTAASFDPADPYSRDRSPDYGLYFDSRWQPPWDHGYVDWPDFGVPANGDAVVEALSSVLERARSGQDVEIGCIGGHGRTGTALACLAVLAGHPPLEAVAWVRKNYCAKAVETPGQEDFVAGICRRG
jgi:Protein-tyrosine phosphatase